MTRYFAVLDSNNLPIAWYNDDIYPNNPDGSPNAAIPQGTTEVTLAQWLECINNNGLRQIVNGALVTYTPPPPEPTVPETISQRQFMEQLAVEGDITWDECLNYLGTGAIPQMFLNAINEIPTTSDPNAQNKAKTAFVGATSFDRHNQLTIILGELIGKTSDQLDAIWTAAAQIT